MDLESECSALESVEDNEEITSGYVLENLGNTSESRIQYNGCDVLENGYNNELPPEVKQRGTEASGYVVSPPVHLEAQASPLPPTVMKGHGLKKWRRIRRDPDNNGGECRIETGRMVAQDILNSRVYSNSSKRMQYAERREKSEGSVSSTNAVVRSLDGFALLDDSGLGLGSPFAAGTDSENSEDRSSKSSTAASAPRMKYEIPVYMGHPLDKIRMRSLSGKNLTHSVHHSHQQGKGRIEATKKARGGRVKIEKENSHSSVESDSRSSTFVFMQGMYSTNNGIQNRRPKDYDGEDGDDVRGIEQLVSDGHQGGYHRDGDRGFQHLSPEGAEAGSSWAAKEERSENYGSSRDHDPLVESIFALQSAQEALEKELLKFRKIKDGSTSHSVSESCTEFKGGRSEVLETVSTDDETELENLFKQKVEAEVEYLTISTTLQKLRVDAANQIAILKDQKALASEQAQILNKLGDAENRASTLQKEAEKLENYCEDIVCADETLRLQNRVIKYSLCFLLQLMLLIVIVGVFESELSPDYVEIVPT